MDRCTCECFGTFWCQLSDGHTGPHRFEDDAVIVQWSERGAFILTRAAAELAFGNPASQCPATGPTAQEIDEELRKRTTPEWLKRAEALLAELEAGG